MTIIRQKHIIVIICLFITGIYSNTAIAQALKVTALRTEYTVNPIGIDVTVPRLSWKLAEPGRNIMQTAYELKAAKTVNDLKTGKSLLWDSKKVMSDQSVNVEYAGEAMHSGERVYWQVRVYDNKNHVSQWSEVAYWEMGLLNLSDWKAAWIVPNWKEDSMVSEPCPMLRKEFNLTKKIKQARVYVSSHGLYLMDLNGSRVSDNLFTPGWTSYHKRLQYQVFDITPQLKTGRNVVGVTLGDGWYRGFVGWEGKRNAYGTKLALIMQIEVIYDDNTKEIVTTDETWKATTGPILKSEIYNGETYDARLEKGNWTLPGYNDKDWKGVLVIQNSKFKIQNLVATVGPPVRRTNELKPVRIFKAPNGETLIDMGETIVGWLRMEVTGKKGTVVTLKFGEMLDMKGNFYRAYLRAAKCTEVYTLNGNGKEIYEPHFTYHSFRYIAVDGYPGEIKADNFKGIEVHSDLPHVGNFKCSDSLVNKLQHTIYWTLKSNFLSIPIEPADRDERLGFTGDAQEVSSTACFNLDLASLYTKWLKDISDDQLKSGSVPDECPDILDLTSPYGYWSGNVGWADAAVILPWNVYMTYGDTRTLKVQYESMKAWVEFMRSRAGESYIWNKDPQLGDWLSYKSYDRSDYPGATTDKDFVATAFFEYSTGLLAKTAEILGKQDDAKKYNELKEHIKAAFQKEFITPNGRLSSNTQTSYVLALAFDLLPNSFRHEAAERLAEDVKNMGFMTTGFLGAPLICQVLANTGHLDLAYKLLLNKEYPSWLYPITKGATTMWECLDAIKPDSTFHDYRMNSLNLFTWGDIGYWLYSAVAGIQKSQDAPGYKKIIINPQLGGKLTFAEAEHESVYGKIKSDWHIVNNEFNINITVPPNSTAEVHIPSMKVDDIKESNKPVNANNDIKFIKSENGQSVFLIGSGDYSFTSKLDN